MTRPEFTTTNLSQLRELVKQGWKSRRVSAPLQTTGIEALDELLGGGFATGTLYEFIADSSHAAGGTLLLRAVVRRMHEQQRWTAFVDGTDAFDPKSLGISFLVRTLWVRCRQAIQAIKATDLLLRDGNLEIILLDLSLNPSAQLNKIPSSTWFRFQRLLEMSSTKLVVLTSRRMVSSTRTSFHLSPVFRLDDLGKGEADLLSQLKMTRLFEVGRMQPAPKIFTS